MSFTEQALTSELDRIRSQFHQNGLEISSFAPENDHIQFEQPNHRMATNLVTKIVLQQSSKLFPHSISIVLAFHLPREYPEQRSVMCLNESNGLNEEQRSKLLSQLNAILDEMNLLEIGLVEMFQKTNETLDQVIVSDKLCILCSNDLADIESIRPLHCDRFLHLSCLDAADHASFDCDDCKNRLQELKKSATGATTTLAKPEDEKEEGELSESDTEATQAEDHQQRNTNDDEETTEERELDVTVIENKKSEQGAVEQPEDQIEAVNTELQTISLSLEEASSQPPKESQSTTTESETVVVAEATSTDAEANKPKRSNRRQRRKRSRAARKDDDPTKDVKESPVDLAAPAANTTSYHASYEQYASNAFTVSGGRFFDRSRLSHGNDYSGRPAYSSMNDRRRMPNVYDPDRYLNGPRDRVGYFAARRWPGQKEPEQPPADSPNQPPAESSDMSQPPLDVFAENYRSAQSAQTRRLQRSQATKSYSPHYHHDQYSHPSFSSRYNSNHYHTNRNMPMNGAHYSHPPHHSYSHHNAHYNDSNYSSHRPKTFSSYRYNSSRSYNQPMMHNHFAPNNGNYSGSYVSGSHLQRRPRPSITYYGNYYGNVMPDTTAPVHQPQSTKSHDSHKFEQSCQVGRSKPNVETVAPEPQSTQMPLNHVDSDKISSETKDIVESAVISAISEMTV